MSTARTDDRPAATVSRVVARPAGPMSVVAFGVLLAVLAVVIAAAAFVLSLDSVQTLLYVVLLGPSVLYSAAMTYWVGKVALGIRIDRAGLRNAAKHSGLLRWSDVSGLRWGRTPWWGRRNHQLIADRPGRTSVVLWGVKTPKQHDRLVAALREAEWAGLIPVSVARAADLLQPWGVVAAGLNLRTAR